MIAQGHSSGLMTMHLAYSGAMAACGLAFALVFAALHRRHRAPYLWWWTMGWTCVLVQFLVGGLLLSEWFGTSAASSVRTLMSLVTQLSHYLQVGCMLLGTAALLRGSPVGRRLSRQLLTAIAVFTVLATLLTIPASVEVRMSVRLTLRHLITGGAFAVAAAILLLRARGRLGQVVVGTSFALISVVNVCYALLINASHGSQSDAQLQAIDLANLLSHCIVGFGLAVWAFEDQDALAATRGEVLTERTRQLMAAQKMEAIGRLAGGVAHDFNNLLTVIGGIADQLDHAGHDAATRQRTILELRLATRQATKMTSQLLAIASSRQQPTRVVDLGRAVNDLSPTLRRLIGESMTIAQVLPSRPLLVRLQPGHIEQILLNLVVNARDACQRRGEIEVGVREIAHGTRNELWVRDQGVGMFDEVRLRAMEPFFTTKGERGTGLGLAVVYGIAHQSNGLVEIDTSVGRGTTVRISWPLALGVPDETESGRIEAPSAPPPSPAPTDATRRTILLAEDEPAVLDITAQSLRLAGYDVLTASDGENALRVAAAHHGPIHVLLTDVRMPGLSGPDLAQQLQTQRPDIRVLFVSGYVDQRTEAMMTARIPLLEKPFTRKQLLAYLQQYSA